MTRCHRATPAPRSPRFALALVAAHRCCSRRSRSLVRAAPAHRDQPARAAAVDGREPRAARRGQAFRRPLEPRARVRRRHRATRDQLRDDRPRVRGHAAEIRRVRARRLRWSTTATSRPRAPNAPCAWRLLSARHATQLERGDVAALERESAARRVHAARRSRGRSAFPTIRWGSLRRRSPKSCPAPGARASRATSSSCAKAHAMRKLRDGAPGPWCAPPPPAIPTAPRPMPR